MNAKRITDDLKHLRNLNTFSAECVEDWETHDELIKNAKVCNSALKLIAKLTAENEELRARLVRQACYFEQIEAREQPRRWPLLNDDCGEGL